jgi:hypothetical protein
MTTRAGRAADPSAYGDVKEDRYEELAGEASPLNVVTVALRKNKRYSK